MGKPSKNTSNGKNGKHKSHARKVKAKSRRLSVVSIAPGELEDFVGEFAEGLKESVFAGGVVNLDLNEDGTWEIAASKKIYEMGISPGLITRAVMSGLFVTDETGDDARVLRYNSDKKNETIRIVIGAEGIVSVTACFLFAKDTTLVPDLAKSRDRIEQVAETFIVFIKKLESPVGKDEEYVSWR